MPPEVLKNILGHKSIDVTIDTYFDALDRETLYNALNKIKDKYNLLEEKLLVIN